MRPIGASCDLLQSLGFSLRGSWKWERFCRHPATLTLRLVSWSPVDISSSEGTEREDNVYKVFSTQLSRIPCSMNFSSCVYYSFKTFPSRNEIYPLRGHMEVYRHILVVGRSQEYYYTFCNVQESIPSLSAWNYLLQNVYGGKAVLGKRTGCRNSKDWLWTNIKLIESFIVPALVLTMMFKMEQSLSMNSSHHAKRSVLRVMPVK